MTYTSLFIGFVLQLTVAPICAVFFLISAIIISSKFSLPSIILDILLNVGIYTFPISWFLSFYMMYDTYVRSNDTYNTLWHAFPFAVVFISSILVGIYIKFMRTPR